MSKSLTKQLQNFVESQRDSKWPRSKWLEDDLAKAYVRCGIRFLNEEKIRTLEIASFEVIEEKNQGCGIFSKFLQSAIENNPFDYVYVENVFEERFANFFRKKNWVEIKRGEIPCFFFKTR